ncbi:MAG: cystathionine gamma-synthase, partial [Thermoprotei archaeon ex4572_64]
MLEHVIARLEEAEDALCFSSGMAAISTLLLAYLRRGDKVLIPYEIYGATLELIQDLQKFDIKISYTWPETNDILESIERDVKLIIIETMTNPTLKVIDVREVVKKSLENNSIIIIDNTFVTPVLYQPIPDGATFVLHSMTKYMSGHNDTVAGVIAGSSRDIRNLWNWRRKVGTILAPFEAYLVMRGIKTLSLRVKKHCENAKIIAEYLKEHSKIEEVLYPGLPENKYHDIAKKLFKNGFGGVVSFKIRGSYGEVIKLLKNLKIIKPSPSLGGPETLLTYPIVSASKVIP